MNAIDERRRKVLEFIKEKQRVQISDLSQFLDEFSVDKKTIQRDLNALVKEKQIEKLGELKFTYYQISELNKILQEIDVEDYF